MEHFISIFTRSRCSKKNVSRSLPVCLLEIDQSSRARCKGTCEVTTDEPEPFRSRACVPVTESLWTQAGSDRNLLVDRPLPFALFGCCFIYVNSLLSPDLFQCEARSREDLLRPSLVCLQMCSPRSQPQRKTRGPFFLSLSLSTCRAPAPAVSRGRGARCEPPTPLGFSSRGL